MKSWQAGLRNVKHGGLGSETSGPKSFQPMLRNAALAREFSSCAEGNESVTGGGGVQGQAKTLVNTEKLEVEPFATPLRIFGEI
jgi:hypothetical protein